VHRASHGTKGDAGPAELVDPQEVEAQGERAAAGSCCRARVWRCRVPGEEEAGVLARRGGASVRRHGQHGGRGRSSNSADDGVVAGMVGRDGAASRGEGRVRSRPEIARECANRDSMGCEWFHFLYESSWIRSESQEERTHLTGGHINGYLLIPLCAFYVVEIFVSGNS
jgi:hypothetical protein